MASGSTHCKTGNCDSKEGGADRASKTAHRERDSLGDKGLWFRVDVALKSLGVSGSWLNILRDRRGLKVTRWSGDCTGTLRVSALGFRARAL